MKATGEKLAKILACDDGCVIFLHNTRSEAVAKKILAEGFTFQNQLYYSTDRINPNDGVEISYFLVERKEYGDYTIIIKISRSLFKKIYSFAEDSGHHLEEVLSINEPVLGDDDEYVYTISPHYVMGYFNNKTGALTCNPDFDPEHMAANWLDNINRIRNE